MPQQLLIPRENDGNLPDRATVYGRTASRPNGTGSASVTAYLDDLGESGSASRSHPFVEDSMTLAFQHLDVVLALRADEQEIAREMGIGGRRAGVGKVARSAAPYNSSFAGGGAGARSRQWAGGA